MQIGKPYERGTAGRMGAQAAGVGFNTWIKYTLRKEEVTS